MPLRVTLSGLSSAAAAPGVHVPALGAGLACGAAHLAWQLRTVDFHSRADCLRKFQSRERVVKAPPRWCHTLLLSRPGRVDSGPGCSTHTPETRLRRRDPNVAACGVDVSLSQSRPCCPCQHPGPTTTSAPSSLRLSWRGASLRRCLALTLRRLRPDAPAPERLRVSLPQSRCGQSSVVMSQRACRSASWPSFVVAACGTDVYLGGFRH